MHLREIGKPYSWERTVWPEVPRLILRPNLYELAIFIEHPTDSEIAAVDRGKCELGLYVESEVLAVCYRFGPGRGFGEGLPWSHVLYSYHLVPKAERMNPLFFPGEGLLQIVLVDAAGGLIRALRLVSLPCGFAEALERAIRRQARRPLDQKKLSCELELLAMQYPSPDMLAEACWRRTSGDD
jgi:hypothetical protein